MHFDHDFGVISSLVKIDTTIQPLQGGTINILDVVGTGGIKLPAGTASDRPATEGVVRYNTSSKTVEYNDGQMWQQLAAGGTVKSVVQQAAHGFTTMQLVQYVNPSFVAADSLNSLSGVVSRVIDANTFEITHYGTIQNLSISGTNINQHLPTFWWRNITTGAIEHITSASLDRKAVAVAALLQSIPTLYVYSVGDGTQQNGFFDPANTTYNRPWMSSMYGVAPNVSSYPILISDQSVVADPTSNKTLAWGVGSYEYSIYEMPSQYLRLVVAIDALATLNTTNDVVLQLLAQDINFIKFPPAPGSPTEKQSLYLGADGLATWTPPSGKVAQVIGYYTAGSVWFMSPYIENTTTGAVYISTSQPSVAPGTPYMWIQTGLNTDGNGMTFWIEDGL